MKKLKYIFILSFFSLFFVACQDITNSLGTDENTDSPTLRTFLANIDANETTAKSLGRVDIISTGGASISSFRLQGSGYTNFNISSTGEISTRSNTNLNCTTYKNYDLEVIATNKYGDSNKAQALIQVNCGDEPVLEPYLLNLQYQSGLVGTMVFTRTSTGSNNASEIREIQVVDAPDGVSIDSLGNINVSSFLPESRYDIKVRAVNTNNKVGPYVYLTINTGNSGGYIDGGDTSDDWPDYRDSSVYTAAYVYAGGYYDVYGYMNHTSDHDYIKIYIDSGMEVSFALSTDGSYDYGNGGNYIALYDEYGSYYGTYSNNYPNIYLDAGYYYINVHETSNSYTLNIYTTSTSEDNIGDDIYSSTYLGYVNSTYTYLSYDSNIDTNGDRDVFQFEVLSDGDVTIGTAYSSFDTYGRLYDSFGNLLFENDDGTDLNFMISQYLTAGTYYIEVSALSDSSTGNYNVYVNYINP
ncbi:MAG: hypothetical protein OQK11_04725 [Thiovulaceae bacterium]|nr:hypothetical protein [Sulfurimonadaceae bacterium]